MQKNTTPRSQLGPSAPPPAVDGVCPRCSNTGRFCPEPNLDNPPQGVVVIVFKNGDGKRRGRIMCKCVQRGGPFADCHCGGTGIWRQKCGCVASAAAARREITAEVLLPTLNHKQTVAAATEVAEALGARVEVKCDKQPQSKPVQMPVNQEEVQQN